MTNNFPPTHFEAQWKQKPVNYARIEIKIQGLGYIFDNVICKNAIYIFKRQRYENVKALKQKLIKSQDINLTHSSVFFRPNEMRSKKLSLGKSARDINFKLPNCVLINIYFSCLFPREKALVFSESNSFVIC